MSNFLAQMLQGRWKKNRLFQWEKKNKKFSLMIQGNFPPVMFFLCVRHGAEGDGLKVAGEMESNGSVSSQANYA